MTDKKKKPSNNGANGRDAKGRFTKGNPGGDGNPYAKQTAKLRAALYKAVTVEDIDVIVKKMVNKARLGDTHAAQFVFDRIFGKALPEGPLTVKHEGAVPVTIIEETVNEK